MAQKYRRRALAVLTAAALTTAVPQAASPIGADNSRGTSQVGKGLLGPRRGRPRKFSRPSRSVTLTLPDDVIAALLAVDSDLSRAVVRAVQPFVPDTPRPAAEVVTYGGGAVISVTPAPVLQARVGVELVPLTDGRALIALSDSMSVDQLELRVRDVLADSSVEGLDRQVLEALADILQGSRLRADMTLNQRGIIVLHFESPSDKNI